MKKSTKWVIIFSLIFLFLVILIYSYILFFKGFIGFWNEKEQEQQQTNDITAEAITIIESQKDYSIELFKDIDDNEKLNRFFAVTSVLGALDPVSDINDTDNISEIQNFYLVFMLLNVKLIKKKKTFI